MSLQTNFHAPRTTLSGRIQIGQKSGYYYLLLFIYSVNIKPPRHRFGLSLCLGLAIIQIQNNLQVGKHCLQTVMPEMISSQNYIIFLHIVNSAVNSMHSVLIN